jgi:hypothetical protein
MAASWCLASGSRFSRTEPAQAHDSKLMQMSGFQHTIRTTRESSNTIESPSGAPEKTRGCCGTTVTALRNAANGTVVRSTPSMQMRPLEIAVKRSSAANSELLPEPVRSQLSTVTPHQLTFCNGHVLCKRRLQCQQCYICLVHAQNLSQQGACTCAATDTQQLPWLDGKADSLERPCSIWRIPQRHVLEGHSSPAHRW